jgi:lipooligosaccharide transport system ATP-binding protein
MMPQKAPATNPRNTINGTGAGLVIRFRSTVRCKKYAQLETPTNPRAARTSERQKVSKSSPLTAIVMGTLKRIKGIVTIEVCSEIAHRPPSRSRKLGTMMFKTVPYERDLENLLYACHTHRTEVILMIHAQDLVKKYDDFSAVDGINFRVTKGEAFGLLGPNGAGKSTTMRMICSTLERTSGELSILGKDPREFGPEIRSHIGVVPQQDNLDTELKVHENLYVYGRYFGLSRKYLKPKIEELLDFAQLQDKRDAKVDSLSGGMKRRLTIARALINEPEILMLDEPTTGLDPQARHILWDRLFRLRELGVTLVLTTHYMDEAEQLCDRLVVMDKGRIMAEGSPLELIRKYSSREVVEVRFGSERNSQMADQLSGIGDRLEVLPDRILIYTEDGESDLNKIVHKGLNPITSLVRRSSLEDVFLRLTGRSLVE